MFKVYILKCADSSLYTGQTNDLESRIKKHNNKKGSKYLMSRLPVKLVYSEECKTRSEAMKREAQIKSWPREKKLNLIKRSRTKIKKQKK